MAHGRYDADSEAYTLTMTKPEAEALMDVLAAVAGPREGRRRYISQAFQALRSAGLWITAGDDISGGLWVHGDDESEWELQQSLVETGYMQEAMD